MKKLYFTLALAAVAVSANAFERSSDVKSVEKSNLAFPAKMELNSKFTNRPMVKAESNQDVTVADYAGEYIWTFTSLLKNGGSNSTLTVEVVDAETGEVDILGFCPVVPDASVSGTLDLVNGTLTILNKQLICDDGDGPCYLYLKDVDNDGYLVEGASSAEAIIGTIAGSVITFPEYDIWAVGDYDNEEIGWWYLSYNNAVECVNLMEEVDPNEGWHDYATATFVDGWCVPAFNGITTLEDVEEYAFKVNVQQSDEDENLLRLDNPYRDPEGIFMVAAPQYLIAGNGYIVIDVTDPEFVCVVPGINCGTNIGGLIQAINVEGYFSALGYDKATIQAGISGYEASTFENNVISIPMARFLVDNDGPYTWNGKASIMRSTITFDSSVGVESVNTTNGAAEYFNLQGVRVANPAEGQLLIKVQDGKAVKTIVK